MQFSYFFPWWISSLLLIALIGWAFWCYHRLRDVLDWQKRALLIGLRAAAGIVLFFCLLTPVLTSQERLYPKPHLLLLLDQSQSMSIRDVPSSETPRSRFEQSVETLSTLLPTLDERFRTHLYVFGSSLTPVEDLAQLEPTERETDIPGVLRQAAKEWRGQPVDGVLLLTDGQNVPTRRQLADFEIPVHVVGFGDPNPPSDLKITDMSAPPIVYAEHPFEIHATVQHHGFEGKRIPLALTEGSRSLGTQMLTLGPAGERQQVIFEVTPEAPGYLTYTLETPTIPGELTSTNNSQQVSAEAVQAKLRVFYLEGAPRWESRFLKRALERDPNVELTFLILSRRPRSIWRQTQLARTNGYYPYDGTTGAFPATSAELSRFDAILFGDVDPTRFDNAQMQAIQAFVEDMGRSVLFLAGPTALGRRGWQNTPLAPLLPVDINNLGARLLTTDFYPELTVQGLYHSSTQLGDPNREAWRALPALSTIYDNLTVRAGTTVLAEYRIGARQLPVLAFQRYGRGRSYLVASDTLWNWAFQGVLFGEDGASYRRFWSQTIRWLATHTEARRINATASRSVYDVNETAEVQVRTYDASYLPASVDDLNLTLISPDGQSREVFANEQETGFYSVRVKLRTPGDYALTAESTTLGSDRAEWLVQVSTAEYETVFLNEPWLQELATLTGGSYAREPELDGLLDRLKPGGEPVVLTHTYPLWDSPWFFLVALGLLGTEWYLRKRNDLV